MEYKFITILDIVQKAWGTGKSKDIKPIKWLVGPEELHKFMVVVLEKHGVIKNEKGKGKRGENKVSGRDDSQATPAKQNKKVGKKNRTRKQK